MSTQTIASPENIFNTLWGFQRTAALKTGIDLDIFTAIAEGDRTAAALAKNAMVPFTVALAWYCWHHPPTFETSPEGDGTQA